MLFPDVALMDISGARLGGSSLNMRKCGHAIYWGIFPLTRMIRLLLSSPAEGFDPQAASNLIVNDVCLYAFPTWAALAAGSSEPS